MKHCICLPFSIVLYKFLLLLFLFLLHPSLVLNYTDELIDLSFHQRGSAFIINDKPSNSPDLPINFASASNNDRYLLNSRLGLLHKSSTIWGSRVLEKSHLHITVHTFDSEISEETKSVYFLCHAHHDGSSSKRGMNTESEYRFGYPIQSVCCIIYVNASYFSDFTSCVLKIDSTNNTHICHASLNLPPSLWKQKKSPEISLSYTYTYTDGSEKSRKESSHKTTHFCHLSDDLPNIGFISLPSINIAHSVSDAIREIGRSLLLQIPRRELKTNEEFYVPVRLKRHGDVSDFTLRWVVV